MSEDAGPPPVRVLERGETLADRFVIERLAGSGGMGSLYRAHDRVTGSAVAIKTLRKRKVDTGRFLEEARVLASMRHPANVAYVAHGTWGDDQLFLAMEWLEGEDAATRVRRSVADALTITRRAASGLAVAHQRGVIHRDVKPSNIFLVEGRPERTKLVDFGVALDADRARALTKVGAFVGTMGYLAPEQASRDSSELDPRADVFSLGCVLFELLTGRQAFMGVDAMSLLGQIMRGEVLPPSALRPEIMPALDFLVARMLAKDRAGRPRDGAEVEAELAAIMGAMGIPVTPAQARRGRYRLLELLDESGVGTVHIAQRDGAESPCALKQLREELSSDAPAMQRLQREARIRAKLDHPHIAKMLEAGIEDGVFCIATELVTGLDLAALQRALRRSKAALPAPLALKIGLDVLDALAYAHRVLGMDFVHRDITPESVMVGFDVVVKVIDFGIARGARDALTAAGVLVGAPRFASPEQAAGGPIDARSDLYSLSMVLFELLAGAPVPVAGLNEAGRASVPPLSSVNGAVSRELGAVIARGMAKDRAQRWPDATSYAAAIRQTFGTSEPPSSAMLAAFMRERFEERRFSGVIHAEPDTLVPTKTSRLNPAERTLDRQFVIRMGVALIVGLAIGRLTLWQRPVERVVMEEPPHIAPVPTPRVQPVPTPPVVTAAPAPALSPPRIVPKPRVSPSPVVPSPVPVVEPPVIAAPPPVRPRTPLAEALDRLLAAPNAAGPREELFRQLDFHPKRASIEVCIRKARAAPSGEIAARHLKTCVQIIEP